MKKTKQLTIAVVMTLMACSSFDEAFVHEADMAVYDSSEQVAWQITDDINSVEVANIVKRVFGRESMSRSSGYSVSIIKGEQGEDAIICINLENEGGFLLLSAVKTYSPILAYSKSGHFDVDTGKPDGLSEWINMTEKDIEISKSLPEDSVQSVRNEWRIYEENKFDMQSRSGDYNLLTDGSSSLSWEEIYTLTRIMMSKMSEWSGQGYRTYSVDEYNRTLSIGGPSGIADYLQANMYPLYIDDYNGLAVIVEKDYLGVTTKSDVVKTKWSQESGFNQVFPFKDDNPEERIPVGCGPIAVGQIMYAYQYPQFYNWNEMTLSAYGNLTTSNFLYDVYEKCGAKYDSALKGTNCYQTQLVNALNEYGYTCTSVGKSGVTESLLYNNSPLIITSTITMLVRDTTYTDSVVYTDELESAGHFWIVDGNSRTDQYTTVEIWSFRYDSTFECLYSEDVDVSHSTFFNVNWGWGGYCDGAYSFKNIVPKDGESTDPFVYNTYQGAVAGIKPANQ